MDVTSVSFSVTASPRLRCAVALICPVSVEVVPAGAWRSLEQRCFKVCSKRAVSARLARSSRTSRRVGPLPRCSESRRVELRRRSPRREWRRAWDRCEALAGLGCHVSWREADLVLGQQQAGDVAVWPGSCGSARSEKEEGRSANDSYQLESHDCCRMPGKVNLTPLRCHCVYMRSSSSLKSIVTADALTSASSY